ncbi:unnamed protein product [Rhizoctonia solani]|uniref:Protein kinase domain-containing protein n=1 Tax=Rhizoctonia solani TaxID=456999 RepID=A0A8H3BEJ2_9AGAM|nr:unnamed protein product [Rhizoctonia solani]
MDVTDSLDLDSVSSAPIEPYEKVFRGRLLNGTEVRIETRLSWWHERMLKVLAIWAKCSHPNIVRLIGKATFQEELAAVYEWHEYTSIREYLERYPTVDRYQLSAQICEGVAYLHSIGIINGDLFGDRILVSSDGVPRIRLSIRTSSTIRDPTECRFSTLWAAPESRKIGAKVSLAGDVFTLGLDTIIWGESGTSTSTRGVWQKAINGEPLERPINTIPVNEAGNAIWDILSKCWSIDPENRPSAKHVCDVMSSVYESPGGMRLKTLRPVAPKLVVTEETSIQDLVAHYEARYLINYTDSLCRTNVTTAIPIADTALANVYKINLPNGQCVAVKCVKHVTPHKKLKRAARELSCWSSYEHPNILPLLGFAVVKGDLAMVSAWMSNGCVTEYVVGNSTCDRLVLCIQLARAIAYLHEHNVVHGDIKGVGYSDIGPNVLVSDKGVVKVADFGVSIADHQEIEFSSTSEGRGTERWQARGSFSQYLTMF